MNNLIDVTLPAEQREGTLITLQQWLVAVGDTVTANDPIAELETDKVTMEVCAPQSGVVEEILVSAGCQIEPDAILARITQNGASAATTTDAPAPSTAATASPARPAATPDPVPPRDNNARHLVGPAVRRLLREHDIDMERIAGSGRGGRVTRDDVLAYIKNPEPANRRPPAAGAVGSQWIPHSPMRKAIARHMVESLLHTAPHVTSVFEMDMSNVIEHRRWHKKEFAEKAVNLTFTAYFLAASVTAIRAVPQVNARFHDEALEVYDVINVGIGTALGEEGLVVPVVENVQEKDLFQIAQALQTQTDKARAGRLTPADMKDGTFTISNHGVSGSLLAAPIIINQPQVAILGIGKLDKRVVVVERDGKDNIEVKPMCYVSLTIDHRALDAFQTNRFLSAFVHTIEHWGE